MMLRPGAEFSAPGASVFARGRDAGLMPAFFSPLRDMKMAAGIIFLPGGYTSVSPS